MLVNSRPSNLNLLTTCSGSRKASLSCAGGQTAGSTRPKFSRSPALTNHSERVFSSVKYKKVCTRKCKEATASIKVSAFSLQRDGRLCPWPRLIDFLRHLGPSRICPGHSSSIRCRGSPSAHHRLQALEQQPSSCAETHRLFQQPHPPECQVGTASKSEWI